MTYIYSNREAEFPQSKKAAVVLFIAICLFAMSSWIDVNGLWSEIPLLVNALPEGWKVPSYMVITIQLANVAPCFYFILKRLKPDITKEWIASSVIIGNGALASFLLVFWWDKTTYVGGQLHSMALFVLLFFLSMVDCASTIIYLPYMARFKSCTFLTALFVGEGLSGLVPGLIGLIQNLGTESFGDANVDGNASLNSTTFNANSPTYEPRFSVSVFFAILTILLLISLASFLFVHFHPYFDAFKTDMSISADEVGVAGRKSSLYPYLDYDEASFKSTNGLFHTISSKQSVTFLTAVLGNQPEPTEIVISDSQIEFKSGKNFKELTVMFVIIILTNALNNGMLPSVQSYACLPYSYLTYDLAVKLAILADPIACFLTLFIMAKRLSIITFIAAIGTFMGIYHIYLAALSPNPIMKDGNVGRVLAIMTSVLMSACFAYVKVCISNLLSELGGERMLIYCGIFTQLGSLLGGVTAFLLVNPIYAFKSE